ncbi:unnamed protein product [Strongylus vulgaris]|uniref:Uncharacterized protein n=1 Tax=Strongylus vulgaris TaxID=40348 RepID=A0A3P7JHQ6_STRVU|nr:unnamed protein product [Strongylus vulgaris]
MFNRQVTELHSTRSRVANDDKEEQKQLQMPLDGGKEPILEWVPVSSLGQYQSDVVIDPNISNMNPPRKRATSTIEKMEKALQQSSDSKSLPGTFPHWRIHPHLRKELMHKPGSRRYTDDNDAFEEIVLNFPRQFPEEKRAVCLASVEDWVHQKLSEGCSSDNMPTVMM